MPFVPFHDYFPELAERETRTITLFQTESGIPAGDYGLVEMFCDEPGCDCRRVMLSVLSRAQGVVAVVAYGWGSRQFYARWLGMDEPSVLDDLIGPILNLGSPRSPFAPALLALIEEMVLPDPAYVERVKRHYRMMRERIDGKPAPFRQASKRRKNKKQKS